MAEYNHQDIEKKWQQYWLDNKSFSALDSQDLPKYYILDMFPYPSGSGLHVGHPLGYVATDIYSRYKRMQGFNVLHPMGWDAFGLPAEQHAIQTGTHPRETTKNNVDNYRRQIQMIGLSYDWDREINTTDPKYYKWTQWIFLKLFEKGLAYESNAPVNWCPELGTVLANEEVVDGKSERGGYPVIRKPMRQWVLKITEYAERLLQDLEDLDWPESIKEMQRNWIGKSVGAYVDFKVDGHDESFRVFTTRPDTLFGATYCVLAPEHPLVSKITANSQQTSVSAYVDEASKRSDLDRTSLNYEKTGVFTGAYAVNPVNDAKVPIYIADYVLASYGTGAIMAVPGHDERDHEFAKKYDIPIKRVLLGGAEDIEDEAHTGDGELVNSDFLNGLNKAAAIDKMCDWLKEKNLGEKAVNYKLRDWIFSRQRYWGEPFPLAKDKEGNTVAVKEADLPVVLPELDDYKPTGDGEPPLARNKDWLIYKDENGNEFVRETNTMPQWAGSCWYYLRYIDPDNDEKAWDPEKEKYWMPVDLYVGGVEHAVLHLLYARFWHKVLYDCGAVTTKEPFQRLVNQGMILGSNGEKMSKSRGNVVNPDDVIAEWGADSFRLYEMFMGPLEASKPWQTNGIAGCNRFLKRLWRLVVGEDGNVNLADETPLDSKKQIHRTLKKVTEDVENMHFNTGISAMMELVNYLYKHEGLAKPEAEIFALMLAPYAPHLCEELWQKLGHQKSLARAPWPKFDPDLAKADDTVTMSISVNGKLRGTIDVAKDEAKDTVLSTVKAMPEIEKHLAGKNLVKEIFVPGKIINLVVK